MTYRREIFPGITPLEEGVNMLMLSDQELLTRLRRAAKLYVDPAVRERDPYAIKGIGQHILSYIKELRARGFEITNNGDTFIVHQKNQVELRHGERVELVDEWAMKRRVYWAISDEMHRVEAAGNKRRRADLFGALALLYKHWKIKAVSRRERKIAFADEPRQEMK